MPGTGIDFVPNLTGVLGRVWRPFTNLYEDFGRVLPEQIPPDRVYFGMASIPY